MNTLVEEYESTAALKDLSVQADLARPPASTHKQDLSDLFDYKYASDVTLVFQGACFPAHRAILSCRCAYFRELLSSSRFTGTSNQQVLVDSLQSRGIDIPTFACLLRYLYTSDFSLNDGDTTDISNLEVEKIVIVFCCSIYFYHNYRMGYDFKKLTNTTFTINQRTRLIVV